MLYAVNQHKPGFLLLGDYGAGKTFLSRSLVKGCSEDKFKFVSISNPRLSLLELLSEIIYQLGGPYDPTKPMLKLEMIHILTKILGDNFDQGLYTVIIVDEAQSIDSTILLEELRLLLNIGRDNDNLFTLVLIGQPHFLEKINQIPQFKQRLSIRYCLKPLNNEQTKGYIHHRVEVAGLHREVFTDKAYERIHSISLGVPRSINNICDIALLTGFIKQLSRVDEHIISEVGKDLDIDNMYIQGEDQDGRVLPNVQEK